MRYVLFLDDIRDYPTDFNFVDNFTQQVVSIDKTCECIVARSFDDAVKCIENNGLPIHISFDHDLGEEKTGYDFARYLVSKMLDEKIKVKPFTFSVHSANPVGVKNIGMYLMAFFKTF